ncbi:hypothetical protein NJ7G_2384 [Natrinema sp. J7-2]|nr:hypothetical protein NJ7G_2384 [Natrinema sp. J7-2]
MTLPARPISTTELSPGPETALIQRPTGDLTPTPVATSTAFRVQIIIRTVATGWSKPCRDTNRYRCSTKRNSSER